MSDVIMETRLFVDQVEARRARNTQRKMRKAPVIEDGFGNAWANWCHECERYSLEVVRPGKVQCGICGV